ncbi:MAG: asparagine synthase (glutamine-hydrolyzing) [Rhizomicrobium sp.]
MCGIAGVQFKQNRPLDAALLDRLLDRFEASIHHRGPDSSGRFVVGGTALVSTRLAIVDIAHGDQPLVSQSGAVLVANGEIYNSPEIRAHYAEYPFKTGSDCEAIFPLYEKFGGDFADGLRGMYAVALYEPASGRLTLSRDPFGIKPLYFVEHETGFAFASEMSALAGFAAPIVDKHSESEFLQLKYVTGAKTIFPAIQRLEPGETLFVENGAIVGRRDVPTWPRHVPPRHGQPARQSYDAVLAEFGAVMRDAVAVHLRAEADWCLFYSGGVDSTILMRLAKDVAERPVRALTIGYPGREADDESRDAMRLAQSQGVPCERIEMSADDFWRLAPRIVASLDDPMADPAVLPLYMLGAAAQARKYKIAISGEGADEIFGGYARYRRAILPRLFRPKKDRRGVFTGAASTARFDGWDAGMNALEAKQLTLWSSRLEAIQAIDVLERLPNCLLIKLDRALMANGVEGRTPFLDKHVAAFAARIPDRLKANMRFGKQLLRDWLAREVPQSRPYAHKKGFGVPLASWIAPRAAELAPLVAAEPAIARLFAPDEVEHILAHVQHDEQPGWSLLCYALWHAHHVRGVSAEGDVFSVLTQSAC